MKKILLVLMLGLSALMGGNALDDAIRDCAIKEPAIIRDIYEGNKDNQDDLIIEMGYFIRDFCQPIVYARTDMVMEEASKGRELSFEELEMLELYIAEFLYEAASEN